MTASTLITNTPVRPQASFPSQDFPSDARAVIIGGGVAGCSLAFHLTRAGWDGVVLLEQNGIAAGATWHAAGMVGQLRTSNSLTKINKASVELYRALAAETGHDPGWLEVGSLVLATTPERMTQLRRSAAMAKAFGVDAHLITPREARNHWPLIDAGDVLGAVWLPLDGRVIPGELAVSLALGAVRRGAAFHTHTRVESILTNGPRAVGVRTSRGDIRAEWVILCGGMWSRELGLRIGVDIPLWPVEHHYVLSEPLDGAHRGLPCLRDPDAALYLRALDDGALMIGAFQKKSVPWNIARIPSDFAYQLLEPDWDRFAEPLAAARKRVPSLQKAALPRFVNGPESFTPDNQFLMGPPPQFDGLFVLAGFNSVGIASAGGAGLYAAQWLQEGEPPIDLWAVDLRRFLPFQNDRAYLKERAAETLGLHYQPAWPNRELESARGVRFTPLYARHRAANACFGQSMGWERPNWFAPPGESPVTHYSFGRQNWSAAVAEEVAACRNRAAIFDQSTLTKYYLAGRGAEDALDLLCANNLRVPVGAVVYTPMLNARGGYESDLVVARIAPEIFYLISSTAQTVRDADWICRRLAAKDAELTDVTAGIGVVSVMGPLSREILRPLTSAALDNAAFPFGSTQRIVLAGVSAQALRISYAGELGWELHAPFHDIPAIYDAIRETGEPYGLRPAGSYALQCLRLEKAYRAWGLDLSPDDTPIEAGLTFAVDWNKPAFLGRDALLAQRRNGVAKRLLSLVLNDSEPVLWGAEPVFHNGRPCGYTSSAAWSPTLQASVALAWISLPGRQAVALRDLNSGSYSVLEDGCHHAAAPSLRAPYDPDRVRLQS
ncbi:MAG TPA: FAD-dependent oxidoreductase [Verrucomicrobiales bacterium]|nr:FAD-dependent oxidoreductase [Verrucomicrobiales bacterium]